MPVVQYTFEEFAAEQGCDYVMQKHGFNTRTGEPLQRAVFRNGAWSFCGEHNPPSTNPTVRYQLQRVFLLQKLAIEVDAWHEFKHHCEQQEANRRMSPRSCPGAPLNAPELLRAGVKRIEQLRADLAKLDSDHAEELKAKEEKNNFADLDAKLIEEHHKFVNEIESITI